MVHKISKFCSNNDFCKMYIYKAIVYLHWYALTKLHSRQWTWILNLWSSFTREYRSEKQPKKPRRHQKLIRKVHLTRLVPFEVCLLVTSYSLGKSYVRMPVAKKGWDTVGLVILAPSRIRARDWWRLLEGSGWHREGPAFFIIFVVSSHADGGGSFAATRKGICHA